MADTRAEKWPTQRNLILATIPNELNRATVLRYLNERQANSIKAPSLGNEANALRGFCQYLGDRALEDVKREDIVGFCNQASRVRIWRSRRRDGQDTVIQRPVRLKESTLSNRKVILKSFYKWLRGTEDYPAEVRGLKTTRPDEGFIPTDELVTRGDLRALLQAHPDPKDKAVLAVLYDGGLRAGELCALNVGNVSFDEYGAVITLPKGASGLKTGARRIRLFESVPYLHAWFENHPLKANPKAALFTSNSYRAPGARMTGSALWGLCVNAGEEAKLKIHTNPHLFRHSCATEKARLGWTEAQMRAYFGWSRSSTMPSHYVHLAGKDYEEMELERRGLLNVESRRRPALAGVTCRVCGHGNLATAMFCQECRNPVSPEAEAILQERRKEEFRREAMEMFQDMLGGQVPPTFPARKGKASA
jgi:integrase